MTALSLRLLAIALLGLPLATAAQRQPQTPRDPMQEGLPLKPARTLSFTTRTGHWMSVDVSPDGQTLVFDLLGDLYSMPLAGGKATPLTRGMAFAPPPPPRAVPAPRRTCSARPAPRSGATRVTSGLRSVAAPGSTTPR